MVCRLSLPTFSLLLFLFLKEMLLISSTVIFLCFEGHKPNSAHLRCIWVVPEASMADISKSWQTQPNLSEFSSLCFVTFLLLLFLPYRETHPSANGPA